MANRNFPSQKMFGFHMLPARVDGYFSVSGTAGTPTLVTHVPGSLGVAAITRTGTGVYRIQLQDNYVSMTGFNAYAVSNTDPNDTIDPHNGVVGNLYRIVSLGNANWHTCGIPTGVTPAVNMVFCFQAAPGSATTGTMKLITTSNIVAVRPLSLFGNSLGELNNQPYTIGSGGYIDIVCLAATDSSTTTLIPTDPRNGEKIFFQIVLNSSSIQ